MVAFTPNQVLKESACRFYPGWLLKTLNLIQVANDIGDCWQTAWSTSLHKNTLLVNAKAVKAENSPYLFHGALI